jgi:hypothetical protein
LLVKKVSCSKNSYLKRRKPRCKYPFDTQQNSSFDF